MHVADMPVAEVCRKHSIITRCAKRLIRLPPPAKRKGEMCFWRAMKRSGEERVHGHLGSGEATYFTWEMYLWG